MNQKKKAYWDAMIRKARRGEANLLLAVKAYPTPEECTDADIGFQIGNIIIKQIENFTPAQIINLFPVEKTYDGDKYGYKDYFYTMQKIREYGVERKIENGFDFLWDYENNDIREFFVNFMCFMGKIYRKETGKDLHLEALEKAKIPYTAYTDDFATIISYDGKDTKITMPNLAMFDSLK